MKTKLMLASALVFTATAAFAAGFPADAPAFLCRDAFVSMLKEPVDNVIPHTLKTFDGVNTENQSACRLTFSYKETQDKRGVVYVTILNSPLIQDTYYLPATNDDPYCNASVAFIHAKHAWTQTSGWHLRFTTELSLRRLPDGRVEAVYSQDKANEMHCVGTIR